MDNKNMNMDDDKLYFQPPAAAGSEKKKLPEIKLSKRDLVFAVLFFASAFLIVDFIFFHGFNLGFTIAFAVLFLLLTVYLFSKENKAAVFSCICGALSLAGAVTFSVYKDSLINTIMVFLVCALFGIYICGVGGVFKNRQGSFKMLFDVLDSVFVSPLSNASDITQAYGKVMSKNKTSKNIVIGIALSLPVLLVIIPLLASSDAAFENLVTLVLKNIGIYLLEIALALMITPFLIFYAVSKKYSRKINGSAGRYSSKGVVQSPVTISFLCVISLTYIVYLFSQLAYFFSAFSGILPEGYTKTASEYARRGFFEMFAICVINMILIALANALTKRAKGKVPVAVKALSAFILAFTVLILITAMQKMKLNVEIYGLSKNRLLVSVFMLMILIIIFFYIVHIFLPRISYMQPIIVICSATFIALSFANVDGIVAEYNISAYKEGRIDSIDVDYINNLSDSSAQYIIELADCDDHIVAKEAKTIILRKIREEYQQSFKIPDIADYDSDIEYNPDTDFRSYNASRGRACKALEAYYNSLSADEREKLIVQYQFDNGDYYYNEDEDIYEFYTGDGYAVYSYNEKTDRYEYSPDYIFHEYEVYDESV